MALLDLGVPVSQIPRGPVVKGGRPPCAQAPAHGISFLLPAFYLCFLLKTPFLGLLTPPAQLPGLRSLVCGKRYGVREILPPPTPFSE